MWCLKKMILTLPRLAMAPKTTVFLRPPPRLLTPCGMQTSLMLDLHTFDDTEKTRHFRALGAGLLDLPKPRAAAATAVSSIDAGSAVAGEPGPPLFFMYDTWLRLCFMCAVALAILHSDLDIRRYLRRTDVFFALLLRTFLSLPSPHNRHLLRIGRSPRLLHVQVHNILALNCCVVHVTVLSWMLLDPLPVPPVPRPASAVQCTLYAVVFPRFDFRACCCFRFLECAWKEALLAAIVPDDETPGAHVLRLLRIEGTIDGDDDDCLLSSVLLEEPHNTTGKLILLHSKTPRLLVRFCSMAYLMNVQERLFC